jgi:hypothetical protein
MTSPTRSLASIVLISWWVNQFTGVPVVAAERTWIGGNVDWVDNSGNANWAPVADEPDPDDEAIFNTPNTLSLGSNNSIQALTLSDDISLSTANYDLTVDGSIQLVDDSTDLIIGGAASVVMADRVTINNLGEVRMSGGTLNIVEETRNGLLDINLGGLLSGVGTVNMQDALPGIASLLINDGEISATSSSSIIGGAPPPAGTLRISVSDATDGRFDLDGSSGNGVVNAFRNQTLQVNGTLSDSFSGEMNLSHNSTVDISTSWTLDTGTIDVTNGFVPGGMLIPPIPADVSIIGGGTLTQTGGTITVVDSDGTLQFNAPFTMNGGNLVNNGRVVFNADATIGAGANFTMPTASSSITVNAGVTVNIDQPNFNPDGSGAATNVISVNSGGVLDLELGAGADESLSGIINLNGGVLNMSTDDDSSTVNGDVNVGANSGESAIVGIPLNTGVVTFTNTTVTVGANSRLDLLASSWGTSANLAINAGATVRFLGTTVFSGNGSFTGDGTLMTSSIVSTTTFAAVTTINMPGGTVDLDGNTPIPTTVIINEDTTVNVGTMAPFGGGINNDVKTLIINGGADFTVNLTDPDDEWTLLSSSVVETNAVGGVSGGGIQGSDINIRGEVNINAVSVWGARMDISTSGRVIVAPFAALELHGGDLTDDNVNRLEDGRIDGAGVLRANNDVGMFGFGTITSGIEFHNNTELRADNGILTVTGVIFDLGVLGTADTDGILNLPDDWNTDTNIDFVNMRGGEIRGGTITNDNGKGITGFGLISAQVINNTSLIGEDGDTLVVETALNNNDWDGATNAGQIRANTGDVEIRDDLDFPFAGTVRAEAGHTVFANGFELQFQPDSRLELTQGTYRTLVASALDFGEFGGTLTVHPGGPSTLRMFSKAWFRGTSTTTLHADLILDTASTFIDVGAEFAGSGALINVPQSILTIQDEVDLGVSIVNDGVVRIGSSFFAGIAAQVSAVDFEQSEQGTIQIDFQGTGPDEFDRLDLTGVASLDGELRLQSLGGYVPTLGDTFNILSAANGVVGSFATLEQPTAMPMGLIFDVIYSPTLVRLVVMPELVGDYNLNGVVDAADYAAWRDTLGAAVTAFSGADGNGNGTIEAGDYDVWRAHFGKTTAGSAAGFGVNVHNFTGQSNAASANAGATTDMTVPEPASLAFCTITLSWLILTGRTRVCHFAAVEVVAITL